jgi:DNA repair protein RadA/Sms
MEGTRPLLMEVQALVSPSALGTPRRAVVGWDQNRLAMVLAVLEAHAGVNVGQQDVYLNVAGGLRVKEPAADMAVAAALVSSLTGAVIPPNVALFGEIALSGALRPVGQADQRARESAKLGLETAIIASGGRLKQSATGPQLRQMGNVADLVAYIAGLPKSRH